MKKLLSGLLLVCFLLPSINVLSKDNENMPFITKKFPAASINNVEVTTAGGSIQVTGEAKDEATVEVFIYQGNRSIVNGIVQDRWPDEKIQKVLDEYYDLNIKVADGKLMIEAKRKDGAQWSKDNGLSISFKINVGKETVTKLKTSGGSLRLSKLSAKQEISTSGGSIKIDEVTGPINGKTSGGSIQISDSGNDIDLSTSGGSIEASECSGTLTLRTSGGSLKLEKLNGIIQASTSGGSIKMKALKGNITSTTSGGSVRAEDVEGTLTTSTSGGSMELKKISGNLKASTSAGSMKVSMENVSEYVRLSNNGNISLELPKAKGYNVKIKAKKIQTDVKDFKGSFESDKQMVGTIGAGGPEITVSATQRVELELK